MASSSSNVNSDDAKNYDVFISFSGEDVRGKFLSHLQSALRRKQINPFNDEELKTGKQISPALLKMIKESFISIIIFSKNYPYSTWCLEELAQIHHCSKTMNQIVVPVFYRVDPDHFQNLKGDIKDAIVKHRQQISSETVEIWSRALQELSTISGFVSSTLPEDKLVDEIALDISEKLRNLHPIDSQSDGFFGIDLHVQTVESLLDIGLTDEVRVVGIWGMGGIGKTTTADKLYHKVKHNFDAYYFAANVRETLEKRKPSDLRDEIISVLLGEKVLSVGTPFSIEHSVSRRLQCKKVLIVFDDVIDSMESKSLIGNIDLYAPGSRIIVTSRDSQVLKNVGAKKECIYQIEGLKDSEALELFNWHAFQQNHPKKEYKELSNKAVRYAQGFPLALIVLGLDFYDKSIDIWKAKLKTLKSIPYMNIQKILRISYDGLERDEKSMFLDIACFFKGATEDEVKKIFHSFGFSPESAINSLCAKSLITRYEGWVTMHDLLEQMGQEIVRQESNNMLGEQSRLWTYEDIIHVLRNDLGTGKIEGILLRINRHEKVEISSKGFMHMNKLRFLRICYDFRYWCHETIVHLPNGLEFLPETLSYFHWYRYPLSHLPSKFCPNNLVELHLRSSKLRELGNLEKSLKQLKYVDLSYSKDLFRIPDFSRASSLEVLELEGCFSLVEISWPITLRNKDSKLDLREYECLRRLSGIPCNIEMLILNEAIEQLPPNIGHVKSLSYLGLEGCSKLTSLPDSICDLESLWSLNLTDCTNIHHLPKNFGNLQNLEYLTASNSGLRDLPDSINQLNKLRKLDCSGCKDLKLPALNGLRDLVSIDLSNCNMAEFPACLCSIKSLSYIQLDGNDFKSIDSSIKQLSQLKGLYLKDCKRLEYIPTLPFFVGVLDARNCTSLESVSTAVLPKVLVLDGCIKLKHETLVRSIIEENDPFRGRVLYMPESEVLQRMMYKNNNGSSLSLAPELKARDLSGHTLCVVVHCGGHVTVTACLEDDRGKKYFERNVFEVSGDRDLLRSEKSFIWYSRIDISNLTSIQFNARSVCVGFRLWEHSIFDVEILKCGYHPEFKEKEQHPNQTMGQCSKKKKKKKKKKKQMMEQGRE